MVRLLQQNFRSYIGRGSATVKDLITTRHDLGKTEVSNLNAPHSLIITKVVLPLAATLVVVIKLDKNVFWLDVTMQDAAPVQILHSFKKLLYYEGDLVLREIDLVEIMVQFTATHTLHGNVYPFACLEEVKHLDHIWVGDHADDQEFIP
jgi:hypothetical protein